MITKHCADSRGCEEKALRICQAWPSGVGDNPVMVIQFTIEVPRLESRGVCLDMVTGNSRTDQLITKEVAGPLILKMKLEYHSAGIAV